MGEPCVAMEKVLASPTEGLFDGGKQGFADHFPQGLVFPGEWSERQTGFLLHGRLHRDTRWRHHGEGI